MQILRERYVIRMKPWQTTTDKALTDIIRTMSSILGTPRLGCS